MSVFIAESLLFLLGWLDNGIPNQGTVWVTVSQRVSYLIGNWILKLYRSVVAHISWLWKRLTTEPIRLRRTPVMQTLKYKISGICCSWIIPAQYLHFSSFTVAQETYVRHSSSVSLKLECAHRAMARHFVLRPCIPKIFHYCFSFLLPA